MKWGMGWFRRAIQSRYHPNNSNLENLIHLGLLASEGG